MGFGVWVGVKKVIEDVFGNVIYVIKIRVLLYKENNGFNIVFVVLKLLILLVVLVVILMRFFCEI